MKLFVTGGTGFIGSHFINQALSEGHIVKALKRTPDSKPRIKLKKDPEWVNKSMNNLEANDFKNVDVLIHLAAHSTNVPYDSLENCILYNVIDPLILFRKALKAGVKRIIVAGTCFEYGKSGERYDFIPTDAPLEPTQTYPASKAMASIAFKQFALENNIHLSIHRIFQVYGEGELETRLWPSLRKAALTGEDFLMTKGGQVRDFVSVSDVANHFLKECMIEQDNAHFPIIVNVGSGKPQSILEFSNYWWRKWGAKGKLIVGDIPYRDGEVMRYVPKL